MEPPSALFCQDNRSTAPGVITGLEWVSFGLEIGLIVVLIIAYLVVKIIEYVIEVQCINKDKDPYIVRREDIHQIFDSSFNDCGIFVVLFYRVLVIFYFIGSVLFIVYDPTRDPMDRLLPIHWVSYYSYLNYMTFGIYYVVAAFFSLLYLFYTCCREGDDDRTFVDCCCCGSLNRFVGFFFNLKLVTSCMVTIIYWGSFIDGVVNPESDWDNNFNATDVLTHGVNVIILLVEFFVVRVKLYPSQSFVTAIFPIAYLLYLLVFVNLGIFADYPCAYQDVFDPEGNLGWGAILLRLAIPVCFFLVYWLFFGLYLLKNFFVRKCVKWAISGESTLTLEMEMEEMRAKSARIEVESDEPSAFSEQKTDN